MPNGYKLIWSDNALEDLQGILKYLQEKWTEKEIRKFSKKLDTRLNLISTNPLLFPSSHLKKNLRRSVLTYQTTIYYRITGKVVHIVSLFDTRQNPKKLKQ